MALKIVETNSDVAEILSLPDHLKLKNKNRIYSTILRVFQDKQCLHILFLSEMIRFWKITEIMFPNKTHVMNVYTAKRRQKNKVKLAFDLECSNILLSK